MPWFYNPGGDREGSQKDQTHRGSRRACHTREGLDVSETGTDPSQKPSGKAGAQGPEAQAVKVKAQQRRLPHQPAAPGAECANWQPTGLAHRCVLWPTAMFVKNVTELPTSKNRVISYQKLHISACWKTSLESQEIRPHWAHVPTREPLLGAGKQLPPLHGTQAACSPGPQKAWGSKAWAPDHWGSLASGLCHLLVV